MLDARRELAERQGQSHWRLACVRYGGQAMLVLSMLDHCQLPADGPLSMRQTARVIPPLPGIVNVPLISLPLVALDIGDLPCLKTVSDLELSALGSARHHLAARLLVNPLIFRLSDPCRAHDLPQRWPP